MKGATADLWLKIIKPPKIIKMNTIRKSQCFFLINKKLINSFKNFILFYNSH
jgi:hypothetical protein